MFIAMFISFGNCNGMNHVPCNECPNVNVNNVVRFYSKSIRNGYSIQKTL